MKSNIKAYFKNLAIAADQTINAVLGGYPDETLSSRLYRKDNNAHSGKASKCWTYARITVDRLFFWQKSHCHASYLREKDKAHFPKELQ